MAKTQNHPLPRLVRPHPSGRQWYLVFPKIWPFLENPNHRYGLNTGHGSSRLPKITHTVPYQYNTDFGFLDMRKHGYDGLPRAGRTGMFTICTPYCMYCMVVLEYFLLLDWLRLPGAEPLLWVCVCERECECVYLKDWARFKTGTVYSIFVGLLLRMLYNMMRGLSFLSFGLSAVVCFPFSDELLVLYSHIKGFFSPVCVVKVVVIAASLIPRINKADCGVSHFLAFLGTPILGQILLSPFLFPFPFFETTVLQPNPWVLRPWITTIHTVHIAWDYTAIVQYQ